MSDRTQIPFSTFRCDSMANAFFHLASHANPLIVEIGRTRHVGGMEGDGYSTFHFASYVADNGGWLVSIDSDPTTEGVCRCILALAHVDASSVSFVNVTADKFYIPHLPDMISLLYLDGPDCVAPWEDMSAQWHLSCMEFMETTVRPGGLVLIDDCFQAGIPRGKGGKVVPCLRGLGYETLFEGYQWLLRKPSKESRCECGDQSH